MTTTPQRAVQIFARRTVSPGWSRSRKSITVTLASEFSPELSVDMAGAKAAAIRKPRQPGGASRTMKNGNTRSAAMSLGSRPACI